MSKKLDTNWFNLGNYVELKNLDLRRWYHQLIMRSYLKHYMSDKDEYKYVISFFEQIKTNPIINKNELDQDILYKKSNYPFNTSTVESTDTYTFFDAVLDNDNLKDIWQCCDLYNFISDDDKHKDTAIKPFNLTLQERGFNDSGMANYVTVDLAASDEQIMSDFRHWLTEYRKFTGYESVENNFTNKQLSEWVKYQILPYLDLRLIAEFEEKTITQPKIARLIFPNEHDIDITDRLRKVTIPKAEWLIEESTLEIIQAQIRNSV